MFEIIKMKLDENNLLKYRLEGKVGLRLEWALAKRWSIFLATAALFSSYKMEITVRKELKMETDYWQWESLLGVRFYFF